MMAMLGVPAFAVAQSGSNEDVEKLSAIGIATGLTLYDRDKADACVPNALQIRVNIHNISDGGILKLELFGENNFLDGNRRLKKAWNFKPKEPYGLSNNPEIKSLRLPKFSETGFDVPMNGVDIDIHLVDL